MTSTYSIRAKKGIEIAENLDQLDYVEQKIKTTDQINRRTKAGRELTKELLDTAWEKSQVLIANGETPF